MNIYQIIGYLSGIVVLVGYIPYVQDIVGGKSRPQRMSWFIWLILGIIVFLAQLSKGATNSLWLTGAQVLAILVVFGLSIKNGVGGFSVIDKISLALAMVGILVWAVTKEPLFALEITIALEMVATVLTIKKLHEDPESETLTIWVMSAVAALLAILAVGSVNYALLAYPVCSLTLNSLVAAAIIWGRKRLL